MSSLASHTCKFSPTYNVDQHLYGFEMSENDAAEQGAAAAAARWREEPSDAAMTTVEPGGESASDETPVLRTDAAGGGLLMPCATRWRLDPAARCAGACPCTAFSLALARR